MPDNQQHCAMKIIIEEGPFSYSVDWSKYDKIDAGWLDEYFADVPEVIDAVIDLLECVFSPEKIEKELRKRYGEKEGGA